ncbi:hypothetical protein KSZ_60750 [Dictyobacter formicarum]|uniref:Uncharacterized protein n=1 Tax=Dictyobacter formicarum TaxID=2778368 RepID=A0ABQ3VQT3_9CHLR|nr:hypothetical protein KSZ_60750 [Dictyobacter formicarum]
MSSGVRSIHWPVSREWIFALLDAINHVTTTAVMLALRADEIDNTDWPRPPLLEGKERKDSSG